MTRHAMTYLAAIALAAFLSAGCSSQNLMDQPSTVSARFADLTIGVNLSAHHVRPGDSIRALAVIENSGDEPVTISRVGVESLRVVVSRYDGVSWQPVRTFPPADENLLFTWVLMPGQQVQRTFTLPVSPDWPTGQVLRVRAELNGRDGVNVADFVKVSAK